MYLKPGTYRTKEGKEIKVQDGAHGSSMLGILTVGGQQFTIGDGGTVVDVKPSEPATVRAETKVPARPRTL